MLWMGLCENVLRLSQPHSLGSPVGLLSRCTSSLYELCRTMGYTL